MLLISACKPHVPIKAALVVTLKRPPPVVVADHIFRLPDSKPSAKIPSEGIGVGVEVGVDVGAGTPVLVGVGVAVGVDVRVGVEVGVDVPVGVEVAVGVDVQVGADVVVAVGVAVGVEVLVDVGVEVGVAVGVDVGRLPPASKLYAANTSIRPAPKALSTPAVPRSSAELIKADRC